MFECSNVRMFVILYCFGIVVYWLQLLLHPPVKNQKENCKNHRENNSHITQIINHNGKNCLGKKCRDEKMNSPAFCMPYSDERNKLHRDNDSVNRWSPIRNFFDERRKNKNEIQQTP